MDAALRDYVIPIAALLAGGIAPSIGVTLWARSTRGRARLGRTRGWGLALVALVAVACGGVGAWWIVQGILVASGAGAMLLPPPVQLVLGVAIGIPLALPGLLLLWANARATARAGGRKRVEGRATKDDRRAFAADLERQIRDVSTPPRNVTARVGGDGGRVLVLEGDLDAAEGERLTAALRTELRELGFRRVEGTGGKGWWARV
jgi:hypothetical protein